MNPKLLGILTGVTLAFLLFCKAGSSKKVERFYNESEQLYSQNDYDGAIGQYNQSLEESVKRGGKTAVIDKMKRWGIIIGINTYDDPNINGLQFAAPDARSIYEALTHPETGGFKVEHLHLLTSGSENPPTRANILESLSLLSQIIQAGDTVIFYFAGHGITQNGISYLLPADTRVDVLTETATPLSKVYQSIQHARHQLIFLDASHSGWHRRGKAVDSGVMSDAFADAVFSKAPGRMTLTACGINESSFEDANLGYSVFAYYLLEALHGTPDMLADHRVTVSELGDHLTARVKAWAFANRKQQTPQISSNISGDVALTLPVVEELSPAPPADFAPLPPAPPPPPPPPPPQPARKPLIMILLPEYYRGNSMQYPSGETEVIRLFIEQDFPVIDQNQIQTIRYKDEAKRAAQGDVAAAVALGKQFEAEIIIVGEAVSRRAARRVPGNIVSCNAQLVVRAIQTDTAKILATHNLTAKGLDLTEEAASQKALTAVGSKMADYLIGEITHKWNEMTAGVTRSLTLKIVNVTFKELLLFEDALHKRIPSVQKVHRRYFDVTGKITEIEVTIAAAVEQFARELALVGFKDFVVEVLNQTPQVLDIRISQKLAPTLDIMITNVMFTELLLFEDALNKRIPSVQHVDRQQFEVNEKFAEIKVTLSGDSQQFVRELALIAFDDFGLEVLNQSKQRIDIQINQKLSLTLKIVNVTFKELLLFENALHKRSPSVQNVERQHFKAPEKKAGIKIAITGDSQQFVKELALIEFDDFEVVVLDQTPQYLDLRINQKLPVTLQIVNVTFKELLLFEDALQRRIPSVQNMERQYFEVGGKIAEIQVTITGDSQQFVKELALIEFDDFEVEVLNQTAQFLDIQINQK